MAEPINITNSVADIDTAKKTISTPSVTFDIASMKVGENGLLLATSKDGRIFSIDPNILYPEGYISAQNIVDSFDKGLEIEQNKDDLKRINATELDLEENCIRTKYGPSEMRMEFDIKTVSVRGNKLLLNNEILVHLDNRLIAEQADRLSKAGIQLDSNDDQTVTRQEVIEALARDLQNANKNPQASVSPEAAGAKQQSGGKGLA